VAALVGYPPEEQLLSRATPIIDEWNSTWDSAGKQRTHCLVRLACRMLAEEVQQRVMH
jgi:hypothetical protein